MREHIHFSFRELHTNHFNFRSSEIGNNILLARILRTNCDCGGVMSDMLCLCVAGNGKQWIGIPKWHAVARNSPSVCPWRASESYSAFALSVLQDG